MKINPKINRILSMILLSAVPIFFSQCKKLIESVKINVPVHFEEQFTVPVIEDTDNTVSIFFTAQADINGLIKDQNASLSTDNIRAVKVSGVSVKIDEVQQNEEDNLSALESMALYLSSENHTNEVLIAQTSNIADPFYAQLSTEDTDLKAYFSGNNFYFRVELKLARNTTQEIDASAKIDFKVTAGL